MEVMVVCVIVIVFLGLVIIVFCLMDGVDCSHAKRNTLYPGGFEAGVLRKKSPYGLAKKSGFALAKNCGLSQFFVIFFVIFFAGSSVYSLAC